MSFSSKFAMVVEDDPSFRAVAELMLRRLNFKSVVAEENGQQAWAHLNLVRFDFILSDWTYCVVCGLIATCRKYLSCSCRRIYR